AHGASRPRRTRGTAAAARHGNLDQSRQSRLSSLSGRHPLPGAPAARPGSCRNGRTGSPDEIGARNGRYDLAQILIRGSPNAVPRFAVSPTDRHWPATPWPSAQVPAAAALSKMLTSGHHSAMTEDTPCRSRRKTTQDGSASLGRPASTVIWNVWPVSLFSDLI